MTTLRIIIVVRRDVREWNSRCSWYVDRGLLCLGMIFVEGLKNLRWGFWLGSGGGEEFDQVGFVFEE